MVKLCCDRMNILNFLVFVSPLLLALWQKEVAAVELDMCAIFEREYNLQTVYLTTPNYMDDDGTYPSDADCKCTVTTKEPTAQAKSLNVTVEDLQLEACSGLDTDFDVLKISTAYTFQHGYQDFKLCGESVSAVLNLRTPTLDHQYGSESTIFSLGYAEISFSSDKDVQKKGAKLRLDSHRGFRVECAGTSGPLPTEAPTTAARTKPTQPTKTTNSKGNGRSRIEEELAEKKKTDVITGAVVGSLMVVLIIVVAIILIIFIRKQKRKQGGVESPPSANNWRISDRPIYKDPCQGHPNLPLSVKSNGAEVHDQYLYMQGMGKATTPVYADPQVMGSDLIYENEGVSLTEQEYQPGYIIPANPSNSSLDKVVDSKPQLKPNVQKTISQADKKPIAIPRSNLAKTDSSDSVKPLLPTSSPVLSPKSEQDQMPPLPSNNVTKPVTAKPKLGIAAISHGIDLKPTDDSSSISQPALVKPSQMKNRDLSQMNSTGNEGSPSATRKIVPPIAKKPETPPLAKKKPLVKVKPSLQQKPSMGGKIPPPPPSKENKPKIDGEQKSEDPYEIVNVSTN